MKRYLLPILIGVLLLTACSSYRTDVSPEEIAEVYSDAGYDVWFEYYDEKLEEGEIGYIQANHPGGDYIYFSIFETEKEAKADKEQYYHPIAMGLFSVIYGDPSWVRWEVYGNIVVQYDNSECYEVFRNLIKHK